MPATSAAPSPTATPVPVNHDGMAAFAHPATRASSALSATKRIGRRPDRNPSAVPPKRGTTPSAVAATSRSTTTSVGTGSSKTNIEDDAGSQDGDTHPLAPGITDVNRLIGISLDGEAFEFAVNRLNDSELAGACFSPSGRTLFVNIFGNGSPGSGMTLAITGPWSAGPL
jgi:hypothetical protein